MATNTPTLEQLSGSLDALPASLDNLDALPWCNPTLEQLDAWGSLEYIASFGYTLEQLDNSDRLCVLVASGSASVALSASAVISTTDIVEMSASVTGAATATATITPFRQLSGNAQLSISATATFEPVRQFTGNAQLSISENCAPIAVLAFAAENNVSAVTTVNSSVTFVTDAGLTASITTVSDNHILGEDWNDVADGAEIWTDVIVGSEIWAHVPVGNEVWARQ